MNDAIPLMERIQLAFANTSCGVIGLVDELLSVACEKELQVTWQNEICHVHIQGQDGFGVQMPLPKSVMRGRSLASRRMFSGFRSRWTIP